MATPHVVIVGGGFGGLTAARRLAGRDVQVTLLDRRNHHLFQPLLYQVATATLSPGDIAAPLRWVLRSARNVRVLLAEVESVDVAGRSVRLDDGRSLAYDALIVATGAGHAYFGHDEWAPWAPGLKTLEDALEIRRRILLAFERAERETDPARQQRWLTFVLVGGGPTGVELAGTLAEIASRTLRDEFRAVDTRGTRIVLVEAGESILPGFPADLRDSARRSLERLRVDVRERTRVTGIDAEGVTLATGAPAGTEGGLVDGAHPDARLEAGTVIWAAGVAASPLGRTLQVPTDRAGRVRVQPDLTIPGHHEVFVVGDAASLSGADGRPLPGVAQVAMQQAAYAAATILGRASGRAPLSPFRYRDKGSMAIVGRGAAIADLGRLHLRGLLAWFAWLFIHLVMLIGFRSRVAVLFEWGIAYLTFQRSIRLITGGDRPPPAT